MAVQRKPQYLNYLEQKKFDLRKDAEVWLKKKKADYKQAGQSVKVQVSYENDQRWSAKILPKV